MSLAPCRLGMRNCHCTILPGFSCSYPRITIAKIWSARMNAEVRSCVISLSSKVINLGGGWFKSRIQLFRSELDQDSLMDLHWDLEHQVQIYVKDNIGIFLAPKQNQEAHSKAIYGDMRFVDGIERYNVYWWGIGSCIILVFVLLISHNQRYIPDMIVLSNTTEERGFQNAEKKCSSWPLRLAILSRIVRTFVFLDKVEPEISPSNGIAAFVRTVVFSFQPVAWTWEIDVRRGGKS